MTNDKTVTMSRELIGVPREIAQSLCDGLAFMGWNPEYVKELRAILAAPVVERQEPVAWKTGSIVWAYKADAVRHAERHGMEVIALYASPPASVAVEEMAELLRRVVKSGALLFDSQPDFEALEADIYTCLDKVKEMNP